jgi:hypothetical protein
VIAMSDNGMCWTNPHPGIDAIMRVRLLEVQLAAVADAVRILADAFAEIDAGSGVAEQVENLLRDMHVPHRPQSDLLTNAPIPARRPAA